MRHRALPWMQHLTIEDHWAVSVRHTLSQIQRLKHKQSIKLLLNEEGRMFLRTVSMLMIVLLIATSSPAAVEQESKQTIPQMRNVLTKAVEKNRQVTVVLKPHSSGKQKFTGTVGTISVQSFTLAVKDSGQQRTVNFEDIREVRMKGAHIGLYAGIGVAGVAVVLVAFALVKMSGD
jgi:hypothetical protein